MTTTPAPLMLEASAYAWVTDAHHRPVRVLRAVAPLLRGHHPDGRPDFGVAGTHPFPGDGRVTNAPAPDCTRPPEHGLTCRCRMHIRYVARQIAGEYTCRGCASSGPFSVEWYHRALTLTALIECWKCATVDSADDAPRVARALHDTALARLEQERTDP